MARKIRETFFNELKTGILSPLLKYVRNDDTLDMELRGNRIIIYYRGGKILEVKDKSYEFFGLDKKYLLGKNTENPSLATFEGYFPQAKHIIDYYILNKQNHLWEKEIQQRIVQENNYSSNSLDTDFFVIDMEYQDIGRADIVALRWDSTASARKLPKGYLPRITIFEIKQGKDSIQGKSGMSSHLDKFNALFADKTRVNSFKQDMIAVFKQKRELGLIRTINDNKHEVKEIANEIDFVFLLANYKSASKQLKQELEKMSDCKFIYANPMGYGLYAQNIIDKEEFIKRFLCNGL